ncbi:recombinase [Candidatus Parcubacteria bacterium]|nr:MAG: recombinase [Candidatus Parcubacteria bacterium]
MDTDFSAFKQYLQEQDKSPLTIQGYLADLRIFVRWFQQTNGEEFSLSRWASADVRAYRQHLIDQGAKPQTINRRLAALASLGNWAASAGHLPANPAIHVRSLASAPLPPRWLDRREKAALLRAVERDVQHARAHYPRLWVLRLRDAVMVILLLNTGLRVGELCALQLSDVHLSERKGSLVVRAGKGRKQRRLPLNSQTRRSIGEWLLHRPPADSSALFVNQRGAAVTKRTVQRAVGRYAADAGLENVSPHTLRHTFAKSLVDSGVSLEKVATLLGHSDLNTTRIYITPGERDLADAVAKI